VASKSKEDLVPHKESTEERPRSPYAPPYTVTRQGSGLLDESDAAALEHVISNGLAEEPEVTQRNDETPAAVFDTKTNLSADRRLNSSVADSIAQIPISIIETFPANSEGPPKLPKSVVPHIPSYLGSELLSLRPAITLTPVNEISGADYTKGTTILDSSAPTVSRTRLESTASSSLFPGGWFSKKNIPRESETSLDIASGEVGSVPLSGLPLLSPPAPEKSSWKCIVL